MIVEHEVLKHSIRRMLLWRAVHIETDEQVSSEGLSRRTLTIGPNFLALRIRSYTKDFELLHRLGRVWLALSASTGSFLSLVSCFQSQKSAMTKLYVGKEKIAMLHGLSSMSTAGLIRVHLCC